MPSLTPHLEDLLALRHPAHAIGLASSRVVDSALSGLYQSVFRGQGMDFEEVREYREGDEIRNMDWRVTARTGTPHLKVFREERQRTVMLCVDVGVHMHFGTRGTFKNIQAARCAALLGWAAAANHDKLGGILFGDPGGLQYFQPSHSRRALWQLLKAMSSTLEQPCDGLDPFLQSLDKLMHATPTGGLIFLMGQMADIDGLEPRLGRLIQRHEVVLIPIDDVADWDMPNMGQVVFADAQGQHVLLDTDNEQGRARYRQAWEAQRQRLSSLCKRLGVDLMPIQTQADAQQALMLGLRRRAFRVAAR